jgi:hypothetical protein
MGLFFRKSIKVGPFRYNFSGSGMGVSVGVKGFRVGTGPKGHYVHMGRGGAYYRSSIPNALSPQGDQSTHGSHGNNPSQPSPIPVGFEAIKTGDIFAMQDGSSADLIKEIEEKQSLTRHAPFVMWLWLGLLGLMLLGWSSNGASLTIRELGPFFLIGVGGGALVYWLRLRDEVRKSVVLAYQFEPEVEGRFQELMTAFSGIMASNSKCLIQSQGSIDAKYHGGATSGFTVGKITFGYGEPPYVKTNLSVPKLDAGPGTLYFFPDRVLVFMKGKFGAISYEELDLDVSLSKTIEMGSVPPDAKVLEMTWKYLNKKGGPDKRFKDNRQVPIVAYEKITLRSSSGLNWPIQVSRQGVGGPWKQAIEGLRSE